MNFNVRVRYTRLAVSCQAKNDKNHPICNRKAAAFLPVPWTREQLQPRPLRGNKKGATGKMQLLVKSNGAETRIRTRDTRIFSPMLYRLSYLGAT